MTENADKDQKLVFGKKKGPKSRKQRAEQKKTTDLLWGACDNGEGMHARLELSVQETIDHAVSLKQGHSREFFRHHNHLEMGFAAFFKKKDQIRVETMTRGGYGRDDGVYPFLSFFPLPLTLWNVVHEAFIEHLHVVRLHAKKSNIDVT